MKIYLAGMESYHFCIEENINLRPYVLESFYSVNKDTEKLLQYYNDFMLDSGAFTFMRENKKILDWNAYIEKYADFIVRNDIKKFFELDIDSIVGYDKVKEFRYKLECLTNRACIPVWHKSRGLDEFLRMCDEYDYVSIGGIVTKEITPNEYNVFSILIKEAHRRKAKIHGLGFTRPKLLPKYHFDSVDSTSWLGGGRFGTLYFFNGKTIYRKIVPDGHRLKDFKTVSFHNFKEWVKFQKYAENHL